MEYLGKTRAIGIIESIMIGISIVSFVGIGIYRDAVDQLLIDSSPADQRMQMVEDFGPAKIRLGLITTAFLFIWLLLTLLLWKGWEMKSPGRLRAWVILQTLFLTFILLGLLREYSSEFYMNYKMVQLAVFVLYRIWTLYVVWNCHHELGEGTSKGFEVIDYSRSPTTVRGGVGGQQVQAVVVAAVDTCA